MFRPLVKLLLPIAALLLLASSCDSDRECDAIGLVDRCEAVCAEAGQCAGARADCVDGDWICACVPCPRDLGVTISPPDGFRSDGFQASDASQED